MDGIAVVYLIAMAIVLATTGVIYFAGEFKYYGQVMLGVLIAIVPFANIVGALMSVVLFFVWLSGLPIKRYRGNRSE